MARAKSKPRSTRRYLGKTLGDRTHLDVAVSKDAEGKTVVSVDAYPLDAVGQEAAVRRAGVTETAVSWLFAQLEHRLA